MMGGDCSMCAFVLNKLTFLIVFTNLSLER